MFHAFLPLLYTCAETTPLNITPFQGKFIHVDHHSNPTKAAYLGDKSVLESDHVIRLKKYWNALKYKGLFKNTNQFTRNAYTVLQWQKFDNGCLLDFYKTNEGKQKACRVFLDKDMEGTEVREDVLTFYYDLTHNILSKIPFQQIAIAQPMEYLVSKLSGVGEKDIQNTTSLKKGAFTENSFLINDIGCFVKILNDKQTTNEHMGEKEFRTLEAAQNLTFVKNGFEYNGFKLKFAPYKRLVRFITPELTTARSVGTTKKYTIKYIEFLDLASGKELASIVNEIFDDEGGSVLRQGDHPRLGKKVKLIDARPSIISDVPPDGLRKKEVSEPPITAIPNQDNLKRIIGIFKAWSDMLWKFGQQNKCQEPEDNNIKCKFFVPFNWDNNIENILFDEENKIFTAVDLQMLGEPARPQPFELLMNKAIHWVENGLDILKDHCGIFYDIQDDHSLLRSIEDAKNQIVWPFRNCSAPQI